MTSEEFRRKLIEEKYLTKWTLSPWYWNVDGSVNVDGNVWIHEEMDRLPLKFKNVSGSFDTIYAKLKTLDGCPEIVGQWFRIETTIKDFVGFPKVIGTFLELCGNWLSETDECHVRREIEKICNCKEFRFTYR